MTTQTLFVGSIALFLFLSALAHLFMPQTTSSWMTKPTSVRIVGTVLFALSVASLHWHGWFYRTLAIALGISGAWRLYFPAHSIRMQERLYPRWVHGCLLLTGAVLVWLLRP